MMKRTIQTLILSTALMSFGTGCELVEALEDLVEDASDSLNDQDAPDAGDGQDADPGDDQPDLPDDGWSEDQDWACEAELDLCLQDAWSLEEDGVPLDDIFVLEEECFATFHECLGYDDPAWDDVDDGWDDGDDGWDDGDDHDCPDDDWSEEQDWVCEEELDLCLQDVWSLEEDGVPIDDILALEEQCFVGFEDCLGYEDPAQDGDDDDDGDDGDSTGCEEALEVCLDEVYGLMDAGIDPDDVALLEQECFTMFDVCLTGDDAAEDAPAAQPTQVN